MKQGILITAYKNVIHLKKLINFFNDDFCFYIHIDKKTETSILTNVGIGLDLLLEDKTNLYFELTPEICFTKPNTTTYISFKIGFLIK